MYKMHCKPRPTFVSLHRGRMTSSSELPKYVPGQMLHTDEKIIDFSFIQLFYMSTSYKCGLRTGTYTALVQQRTYRGHISHFFALSLNTLFRHFYILC